jgi:hypothetical protein
MNWVFETYSNVYNTAMMQDVKTVRLAPVTGAKSVRGVVARFFGRV